MLTEFVLANVAAGGLAAMASPLVLRALLDLNFPRSFSRNGSVLAAISFRPDTPSRDRDEPIGSRNIADTRASTKLSRFPNDA